MITIYFSKFKKLPKLLLLLIVITCCYGFAILYSAGDMQLYPWAFKQIINFLIFFPVMIIIALMDLRILYKYSYLFYFTIVILLILVALFGHTAMGAKRWLSIGSFRIQPSEPAKIAIVLFLARYFNDIKYENIKNIKYIIPAVMGILFPAALIIKQPDLGTGMVTLFVSSAILLASGLRIWKFAAVGIILTLSAPIIWSNLHNYQKERVLVFISPEHDKLGSGYNIIQSKIAIGSGGLMGKGFGEGTQSHLSFLPEHQTDFIFACLAEDFGLLGTTILLILYSLIIISSLSISVDSKIPFAKLVTVGITAIFFSHVFINVGMVTGLLPVVGIPLPLISYGGTMMASMLIGFGVIMNVHVNRHKKI